MPGLDQKAISEIDWNRAARNILVDSRTDFILAPHLDIVFRKKSLELIEILKGQLKGGTYEPQLPITMSVPKAGILSRPGSILLPHDRLLYQGLVEDILPNIEAQFDRSRSFSNIPSNDQDRLFKPSFEGWNAFQAKVAEICHHYPYILQCDVANFFETLPQHPLINALTGCGCRSESVNLMEKMLAAFRQRSSQGIIQGIYPSDVLGNFYLTDIDADCNLRGLPSARYVDDMYIGFKTELEAKLHLNALIESMRNVGLTLNPTKTKILEAGQLMFEQLEIDNMFDAARSEIAAMKEGVEQGGYGFQGDWINSDDVELAIADGADDDLIAVRALLNFPPENGDQAEKIDRFCLPYLRASGDDAGVERAFDGLSQRPHLTRHYFSYLNHFAKIDVQVRRRIEQLICSNGFSLDYSRMYHMAGILPCDSVSQQTVDHVWKWLTNAKIGQPTRAMAAIFISKFGSSRDRRNVRALYDNETSYVRAAILYSAQFFVSADRKTMKIAWNGHSEINSLIAAAI